MELHLHYLLLALVAAGSGLLHGSTGCHHLSPTSQVTMSWGELESVQQQGINGGLRTQSYYYDDRRRICRYHTDEGGSSLFEYDDSGYLTAYQKGHASGATCDALIDTAQNHVKLEYDGLGRLHWKRFVDWGTDDIRYLYDANNNLAHVTRGGGTDIIHWSYAYNELNQITYEYLDTQWNLATESYDVNYDSYYVYDVDGHVIQQVGRLESSDIRHGRHYHDFLSPQFTHYINFSPPQTAPTPNLVINLQCLWHEIYVLVIGAFFVFCRRAVER